MLTRLQDVVLAPDPLILRDQALNLREAVNSSRARMSVQREQLARLRGQIAELRALASAAPATPPSPRLPHRRARAWQAVPYALILGVLIASQPQLTSRPAPPVLVSAPLHAPVPDASPTTPTLEDDGASEALLLIHEWRLPGDERTVAERLDSSGVNPPGSRSAWTAERTGERVYRVSFHPGTDAPSYDFDVDLDSRRVDPSPETAELIAPRLVSRR